MSTEIISVRYYCDALFCDNAATSRRTGCLPKGWVRREEYRSDVHYCPKHKSEVED